ncbi:hypothetical protein GCM10011428_52630 [Streptomyces violaceus]
MWEADALAPATMSSESAASRWYSPFTRRTRSGVIGSGPWSTHTIRGRRAPPAVVICSTSLRASASYRLKYRSREPSYVILSMHQVKSQALPQNCSTTKSGRSDRTRAAALSRAGTSDRSAVPSR